VPVDPPFNLDTYCHCGPLARTVADAALYENVVAGPDPSDITTLRPKHVLPEELAGVEGLRIALSVDLGSWPVDPDVRANTLAAAAALRDAGAVVEEVGLHVPRDRVMRASAIHFQLAFGAWIAAETAAHADKVTAYARRFAEWAVERAEGGTLLEELELEAALYPPVGELLERFDALICPTVATTGLRAGDDYTDSVLTVDGQPQDFYFSAFLTPVFNVLSRCPVLNVPSGLAANGVPTGLQIAGRTYDDDTVFRVGAALEQVRPWLDVPERRPRIEAAEALR
jgi:Asp-tRNA(Asn)/Glu-tRNA(Gln) amidotransferase A subunit family amidase